VIDDDTNRHGLVDLASRWTPKGLRSDDEALRFMEAVWYAAADSLNVMLDLEGYVPIVFSPRRCLDDDLAKVLALNGVQARPGSLSFSMLRRLAMLSPDLRSWRGAFRSHRTVVSALTGGPVVIQTWILQRTVLDESSLDLILLDDDDVNTTLVYLLGQGPGASPEYSLDEVTERVDDMAKPVLDDVEFVECFAVTAWRDGVGEWGPGGGADWPSAVGSGVSGEYESADIGPAVSAAVNQYLTAPTDAPAPTIGATHSWFVTVWFKTQDGVEGDQWELWLFEDGGAPSGDGYVIKVPVGHHRTMQFCRVIAGVATVFGSEAVTFADGDTGSYHRLDVVIELSVVLAARVRAYCNHDPTAWQNDGGVVATRPSGTGLQTGLRTSVFTAGKVEIAAVTAQFREA
jgi:hypothetical protein